MDTESSTSPSAATSPQPKEANHSLQQDGDHQLANLDEDGLNVAQKAPLGRDRLGSETSSKAEPRVTHKAGSATSKSSGSGRHRQDSLRRAEQATSPSAAKRSAPNNRPSYLRTAEAFAASAQGQGNQYRVGNVGMGGRIYLRPVAKMNTGQNNQVQSPTRTRPAVRIGRRDEPDSAVIEEPDEDEAGGRDEDNGAGNDRSAAPFKTSKTVKTDFTGRESVWTKLSTAADVAGAPSDIFRHRPRSRRSMSESTVDHGSGRQVPLSIAKAFKVVIDRPDGNQAFRQKSGLGPAFDGLDISIPHYQMGSPRFTDQGTPFLQGSTATGSTNLPANTEPQFLENIPDGAAAATATVTGGRPNRGLGPSVLQNTLSNDGEIHKSPRAHSIASFSYENPLLAKTFDPFAMNKYPPIARHETIAPGIYDLLAAAPNDQSVVRYSATGEMIAATPARLIVQITAETFLDYELLSDFFLTVRSYLSINDLLSLLLARFEWAVNRFDDNGRIIRVRSFAAIRHWILNYFAYDFVPDRRLRVQFSRKMNELFKLVQSRREYGLPDMKLISDLKKCWNGRCVLYWDRPVDNSLEADILPGGYGPNGEIGYDDIDQTTLGSVTAASTDGPYSVPGSPPANYNTGADGEARHEDQMHTRNESGTNLSNMPTSPMKERHASLGPKGAQKQGPGSLASSLRKRASNRYSAGSSEIMTAGSQGGSEQQPVASYPLQTSAYRSVLRGHLLAPASPLVVMTPQTPNVQTRSPTRSPSTTEASSRLRAGQSGTSSSGPGVRNLFGNIKRALSSKVSPGPGSAYIDGSNQDGGIGNSPYLHRPMRPTDPLMGPTYRSSGGNVAGEGSRSITRIDLLAGQITTEFQKALQGRYQQIPGLNQHQESQQAHTQQRLRTNEQLEQQHAMSFLSPPEAKQVPSGMTSSSQSIVIVDDTGESFASPMVNGSGTGERTPRVSVQASGQGGSSLASAVQGMEHKLEVSSQKMTDGTAAPATAIPPRLSYMGAGHSHQPSQSSVSLRRVASYQSVLNRPSIDSNQQGPADGLTASNVSKKDGNMIPPSAVPARGLRRVPGGDLRANQNIADLEMMPRPKSTGSIATFASTRESEMLSFGDRITKTFKRDRNDRPLMSPAIAGSFDAPFERDEDDEKAAEKKVSYARSHSDDKAARRPSFEAFVASFADIPDEEEGGIEATLLKLEGKWTKGAAAEARKAAKQAASVNSGGSSSKLSATAAGRKTSTSSVDTVQANDATRSTKTSAEYAPSDKSDDPTPLLERDSNTSSKAKGKERPSQDSAELRPKSSAKRSTTESFLLDEQDDSGSEGLSDDSRLTSELTSSRDDLSTYADHEGGNKSYSDYLASQYPAPYRAFIEPHLGHGGGPTSQTHPAVQTPLLTSLNLRHVPFVLGHDSRLLCEQLTLIEKDALREIDWRDLVDMRWQQHAPSITNWVAYLISGDHLGIDLVTARFNIMVKWALSEIILTNCAEERAQTIVKFIHIAREARRICNYATLLQLTIALTSTDCMRMRKTWALVPAAEREILRDLELLVSPRRNFAGLRSEMEDAPAEHGCIPVVALYIHDLTYNAQKSPQIEVDLPAGIDANVQPARYLINFERYRNTAVIVKNLLRLIDASSRYNYVPVDDVLSHCMWIACLPDDAIGAKSRAIENAAVTAAAAATAAATAAVSAGAGSATGVRGTFR